MKSRSRMVTLAIVLVGLSGAVSACGGSSSSTSASSAAPAASSAAPAASSAAPAPKELNIVWTYTGPENDGGYNVINEVAMNAMGTVPGVKVQGIYDVPYSDQGSQIIKQAIASGANVIVDTVGLGKLLTDVCAQAPEVVCYSGADAEPQPPNSKGWWLEDWNLNYVAGVAAGLMTKTGTLGMVVPYEIPIAVQAINGYALGCQSVKPDCQVKVVYTNSYYDPAAATAASKTLVSAGADVLRNITDDPSFCKVAEEEGVYAVGEYNDFAEQCPKSIITSTVWDFSNYMIEQAKEIQTTGFQGGGGTDVNFRKISVEEGEPGLGTFGDFVPADVKAKVEEVFNKIAGGERVFVGPIYDTKGTERVKAGESLDDQTLFHGLDWFVKGVTTSGGS